MGDAFTGFISPYFDDSVLPAAKLEDFEIIKMLGRGAFGKVFRARNISDDRVVALKQVVNIRANDSHEKSFYREFWSLAYLRHPHIIKMYSGFTAGIHGYICLEDMRCDLARHIKEYPNGVDVSQTKKISLQLFDALTYCHRHSLMHRDLKPSNILIDELYNIKLADFGLSRDSIMDPGPPFSEDVVTLMYRAPEILFGSKVYTYSVDMWSAGCIVYELLTGKVLFNERTIIGVAKSIFQITGNPTEDSWPGVTLLPYYGIFLASIGPVTGTQFANMPLKWAGGGQLINEIIVNRPEARISSEKAFNHPLLNS